MGYTDVLDRQAASDASVDLVSALHCVGRFPVSFPELGLDFLSAMVSQARSVAPRALTMRQPPDEPQTAFPARTVAVALALRLAARHSALRRSVAVPPLAGGSGHLLAVLSEPAWQ